MNNPKLTNILLIAVISFNALFLFGWMMHRGHRNHHRQHFAYGSFYGRGMSFGHRWQLRGPREAFNHSHYRFHQHGMKCQCSSCRG